MWGPILRTILRTCYLVYVPATLVKFSYDICSGWLEWLIDSGLPYISTFKTQIALAYD